MVIVYSMNSDEAELELNILKEIGAGAFGKVFLGSIESGSGLKTVAIKEVSASFETSELEIMRKINDAHCNIIKFFGYFYTTVSVSDTSLCRKINFIMEALPRNLSAHLWLLQAENKRLDTLTLKLFAYQLFRALGYVHSRKICHRDVKPSNVLIDHRSRVLKLCDFGCAREMTADSRPTCSYVCTRFYRAPELVLGASHYSTKIDQWSAGCVVAEMAMQRVLFRGDSNIEMMDRIVRVLGTPTKQDLLAMRPHYRNALFLPQSTAKGYWPRKLLANSAPHLKDFLQRILRYNPNSRMTGYDACAHSFFDELRESDADTRSTFPPTLFDLSNPE